MDENSLLQTRWNCTYHIVFISKYRRKEILLEAQNGHRPDNTATIALGSR